MRELTEAVCRFFRKVAPGDPAVLEWLAGVGNDALDTLEAQLVQTKYLTGDKPTIADINCYCYARLAEEGSFEMGTRPATVAWREAMEALPGWAPAGTGAETVCVGARYPGGVFQ